MRDRPAKLIPASHQPVVIFHGTPSQVINLPDLLGIFGAIGVLGVVFAWVSTRWAVSPAVIVVPALVCLAYLALICVQTAFTEIVIDMERITCREGIVTRKVSSVELFRIQNVVSLHPWWQRFFNVGTIVVTTSDPAFHAGICTAWWTRSGCATRLIGVRSRCVIARAYGNSILAGYDRIGRALMHEYRFDDLIVAAGADDLQAYLTDAHGEKMRPLCMCMPDGVPMYVAKVGEHYVIKRMPNTGGTHAPDCASYEPPAELSGLGEVKGKAIQENIEDGITTLKLDFSLSKTVGRAAPTPSGVAADTVRTDGAKLTLRGTLHYLWEEAGLNRWFPAMAGKRSWYVVRKYLLQAAAGKVSKGEPLGRSLYVPESFTQEHAAGITQRRIAHMAELATSKKTRKLMVAIGEAKEIVESRYGFKIVAKHLPNFSYMLSDELHRRLQKRFVNELALWDSIEDSHLVFIATFGLGPTGIASIDSLAVMVVSANWIPFEHAYDKLMLDALTAHKRRFVKGLRYNLAENKPLACAVLVDVLPEPVALYVQPPGVEQEDEDALSRLIEESDMPSWIWRASEEMPELPVPTLSRVAKPSPRAINTLDETNAAGADAATSSAGPDSTW